MLVKAIIFDLDDTLLWDQRSVKEAFAATCEAAREKYDVDPERLEEAVRKDCHRGQGRHPGGGRDPVGGRFQLRPEVPPPHGKDAGRGHDAAVRLP